MILRQLFDVPVRWHARAPLSHLIDRLRGIRERSDAVAMTPTHFGYDWMGVNHATHALFPARVVDLPYVRGAAPYTKGELDRLCDSIADLGFRQIIFSGFPPVFERLARRLRKRGVITGMLYHGAIAGCGFESVNSGLLHRILSLCREGVLSKLACNKKGLPETITALTGIAVHKFMLPIRAQREGGLTLTRSEGEVHIGVFGYDMPRKNLHTQIAAALLIDGARVHVSGNPNLVYWPDQKRIIRHPAAMPHHRFLDLLGEMDLNLHLSFSETWGQVTAESLALGVPCVIANHSDILDYDPLLREKLMSGNFDDPWALAQDIRPLLAERETLGVRCRSYAAVVNERSAELLHAFLTA